MLKDSFSSLTGMFRRFVPQERGMLREPQRGRHRERGTLREPQRTRHATRTAENAACYANRIERGTVFHRKDIRSGFNPNFKFLSMIYNMDEFDAA